MEELRESERQPDQSQSYSSRHHVEAAESSECGGSSVPDGPPRTSQKRRRCDDSRPDDTTHSAPLPPENLINAILDAYFYVVHPFIPILHEPLLRSRLRDPAERPKLTVVLHAMVVCALRYVANERIATDWAKRHPDALQKSNDFVVLSGIGDLSVESVQALIILVFVRICDGNANKAWPIVGAMTRAVVYLGLHAEPEDDQQGEACVQSFRCLPPSRIWTETEERRRVFWNVFLLDR